MPEANNEEYGSLAVFFGALGSASALLGSSSAITMCCSSGAAYGTAKSRVGISTTAIRKPELIMKSIIPVVMAGIIAIYGLVVSVLIANSLEPPNKGYTIYKGFLHFGLGLSVGLSGLAAGFAIGILGVRGSAQQQKLFVGMILILILAQVLAMYGLIVALILTTKME